MPFKRNNPGCQCCCPCSCYKFNELNDDGKISDTACCRPLSSFSTVSAGAQFGVGHLGEEPKKSAEFTGGTYYQHEHHNCFSSGTPESETGETPERKGLRVWFWLKMNTAPGSSIAYQGIVTKGTIDSSGSPPANTFEGEWGIWYRTGSGGGGGASGLNSVITYKTTVVTLGFAATPTLIAGIWYFYHWYIDDDLAKLHIWNSDTDNQFGGSSISVAGETVTSEDHPMMVGNNAKGAMLGAGSGNFSLENLGFCRETLTEEELNDKAEILYGEGKGLECNASGLESDKPEEE